MLLHNAVLLPLKLIFLIGRPLDLRACCTGIYLFKLPNFWPLLNYMLCFVPCCCAQSASASSGLLAAGQEFTWRLEFRASYCTFAVNLGSGCRFFPLHFSILL